MQSDNLLQGDEHKSGTLLNRALSVTSCNIFCVTLLLVFGHVRPATAAMNIRDFGAIAITLPAASNTPESTSAINAAIVSAAIAGTGDVFLPAGTYLVRSGANGINLLSGITLRGAGQGRTTILCDDSAAAPGSPCISTSFSNSYSDVHVRDLTVRGVADTTPTPGNHLLLIQRCTNCSIENVDSSYSRVFGIAFIYCDEVKINNNRVYRLLNDGIVASNTPNVIIANNQITGAADDAISAHSDDVYPAPLSENPARSGIIISGNSIQDSQGIDVLGAKSVSVIGNVLRRMMMYGIRVEGEFEGNQGHTPNFAVNITGNVITDVYLRPEPGYFQGNTYAYIEINGGPRSAGTTGAVPGWPDASGVIANPYGAGSGYLYSNNTAAPGVATPGGGWFNVTGNTLLRSLPASTQWSQWGFGPYRWVGQLGVNPAHYGLDDTGIPETALNYDGIKISGPLSHSRISGNLIQTTGAIGINFSAVTGPTGTGSGSVSDFDYDDLAIDNNHIADFTKAGVSMYTGATTSNQRINIRNNVFNGDPRFVNALRGHQGTWVPGVAPAVLNGPFGIFSYNVSTAGVYQGNQFRNLGAPIYENPAAVSTGNLKIDNLVFASGVTGYSSTNTGVGLIPSSGSSFTILNEDGNPASITFGRLLTRPTNGH